MRNFILAILSLALSETVSAQNPIQMATQPSLTYLESFDSLSSWTNNFSTGSGAQHFSSVAIGGTNSIPDATRITTSSSTFMTGNTGGLHKDTANDRLIMLVTGTTNNSSSLAFDMLLDFTGVNAGTLSFDWATVFNGASTSNRTGTLKVYASTDGVNYTELPQAEVTITNYVSGSGSQTNVQLPTAFNNSATARLRFYYFNSAGGSSGSRPKIGVDNIQLIASGSPCLTPGASPTSLTFSNVTATSVQGSFNAPIPAADQYLVLATIYGSLSANPVDGTTYNTGDIVGDGVVVYRGAGTSFTAMNLDPSTTYTFYVFPLNLYCNGVTKYRTTTPLSGIAVTPAGPPCLSPSTQPSNLQFNNVTSSSLSGTFTGSGSASEYLVIASTSAVLNNSPSNGINYNTGDTIGGGNVIYRGANLSFTATNLNHSTTYYFYIYSLNNYACSNGPAYLSTSPLTGQQTTTIVLPCVTPTGNASSLVLNPGPEHISGFFKPFNNNNDGYLVVMSTISTLAAMPQDGVLYPAGTAIAGGTVVSAGSNYSFVADSLAPNTTYYFHIFSYNDICIGGPLYKINSYLTGSTSTTYNLPYNYYFGNLHTHSSYSDGNKDSSSLTPSDDYFYAENAQCMDFLGISEHNHYTATDNPGMLLSKYHTGLAEAAAYTASHPGFLALYGMEWGVQHNGGHVLAYGIDQLLGWDSVGGNPNYDIYVAKNDYLSNNGLFRKINSYAGNNAFATLAHPGWSDFQYLAYNALNKRADSAVTGIAVENGPGFSTDTTYSNPASDMSFLPYYLHMLSKGYHVAPMIDHDNHFTTFGRTTTTRTAVLSASLTVADFLQAMKSRRFYATQDCDTRASIEIQGQQMGSILSHPFAPAIAIKVDDPSNPSAVPLIKLMYGTPGRPTPPSVLRTTTGNHLTYTDHALSNDSTAYYYADITINEKRTITAPIWYTRKDTAVANDVYTSSKNLSELKIRNHPVGKDLQIEITLPNTTELSINIYNTAGQLMYAGRHSAAKGAYQISIPFAHLSPGSYILEVVSDRERISRKFIHL